MLIYRTLPSGLRGMEKPACVSFPPLAGFSDGSGSGQTVGPLCGGNTLPAFPFGRGWLGKSSHVISARSPVFIFRESCFRKRKELGGRRENPSSLCRREKDSGLILP